MIRFLNIVYKNNKQQFIFSSLLSFFSSAFLFIFIAFYSINSKVFSLLFGFSMMIILIMKAVTELYAIKVFYKSLVENISLNRALGCSLSYIRVFIPVMHFVVSFVITFIASIICYFLCKRILLLQVPDTEYNIIFFTFAISMFVPTFIDVSCNVFAMRGITKKSIAKSLDLK